MKLDPNVTWQKVDVNALDLDGYQAAILGGTGGIGRAIGHLLAVRGATVTIVGQTFRDDGVKGLHFIKADLSLMRDARRIAAELPVETLDLVLLTAGVMAGSARETTQEGIESDMATSYLSRLVIQHDIGSRLGTGRPAGSPKPRVFNMAFPGAGGRGKPGDLNADKSYNAWTSHANTVAGNEMLVLDGVAKYPHANFYGLNPGLVETNIRANTQRNPSLMMRVLGIAAKFMAIKPEVLAERLTPLLVSPDLETHSGAMFDAKARPILPSKRLLDAPYRAQFLEESADLVTRHTGIVLS